MKKALTILLATTLLLGTSGCFGEFALTRKLHNWNKSFSNSKFVNNLVFYALAGVLPVYEIAGAADLFIFNFIEYWTGNNPMASLGNIPEDGHFCHQGEDYQWQVDGYTLVLNKEHKKIMQLEYLPEKQQWALTKVGQDTQYIQAMRVHGTAYLQCTDQENTGLMAMATSVPGIKIN